jgi:hypothetical protein
LGNATGSGSAPAERERRRRFGADETLVGSRDCGAGESGVAFRSAELVTAVQDTLARIFEIIVPRIGVAEYGGPPAF